MTYIIAEPCIDIKDLSCVDVCPVDCIHEFERILVIDPEECIDCFAPGEQFLTTYGVRTFAEMENQPVRVLTDSGTPSSFLFKLCSMGPGEVQRPVAAPYMVRVPRRRSSASLAPEAAGQARARPGLPRARPVRGLAADDTEHLEVPPQRLGDADTPVASDRR